jgi:hypothetical protein
MVKGKKCFVCEKDLDEFGGVFMLGLDRPYVNLWFHRVCFDEIDDLLGYLTSKIEEIRKELPIYS